MVQMVQKPDVSLKRKPARSRSLSPKACYRRLQGRKSLGARRAGDMASHDVLTIEQFFAPTGPLSSTVGEGYCHRSEQVRMAEAVEETFANGGALLADCPT